MKIDDGRAGRWRLWMLGVEWGEVRKAAETLIAFLKERDDAAAQVARLALDDLVAVLRSDASRASKRQNAVVFDQGIIRAIPVVLRHGGREALAREVERTIQKWEAE